MATICIIDDQIEYVHLIEKILNDKYNNLNIIKMTGYDSSVIKYEHIDLFLLDIDLQGINGIDLATLIKLDYPYSDIVFISAHNQFIHTSLSVQPKYFIRKEYLHQDFQILFQLLDFNKYEKKITVMDSTLSLNSIIYIEVQNHQLTIHAEEDKYIFKISLTDFIKTVNEESIVQIHKSYAVNIHKIAYIKGDCCYVTKDRYIPIGRNYKKNLLDTYRRSL